MTIYHFDCLEFFLIFDQFLSYLTFGIRKRSFNLNKHAHEH